MSVATRARRLARCAAVTAGLVFGVVIIPTAAAVTPVPDPADPPVLAHYYIWFDATSWNRAKSDFPAVGRYSSDETSVMQRHVRQAKSAGIDGFIVSWKSTPTLDERLQALVDIAAEEDFKLAVTYQALDFNREPLPTAQIAADLDTFAARYRDQPVFDIFGKPMVAWTGTEQFSVAEIAKVTRPRRADLLLLATAKQTEDYERIAGLVDGELYYWSSPDPASTPGYTEKLATFGDVVRGHGGLWVAPVAPGYDARLLGGHRFVARRDGDTLRRAWEAAVRSTPAAIGIISWNEFSENTHIEPSERHGDRALKVVGDLTGTGSPVALSFDSSAPQGAAGSALLRLIALGGVVALMIASLGRVLWRERSTRWRRGGP